MRVLGGWGVTHDFPSSDMKRGRSGREREGGKDKNRENWGGGKRKREAAKRGGM